MSQFKSLNKGAGIPASYDTMKSIVRMKQFLLSLKSEIGRETGILRRWRVAACTSLFGKAEKQEGSFAKSLHDTGISPRRVLQI